MCFPTSLPAVPQQQIDLGDILAKNAMWSQQAPAGGYVTQLTPQEQPGFQAWVKQNNVPYDPSSTADYDMPGFYKAMTSGDPNAKTGMNANDGMLHFGDYFKTPFHQSFSAESKYAKPGAPSWNNLDQLVTPDGRVVFDERKR